ncbi:MAG: hypothetical protein ABI627_20885 [Polyangiaceae bacterium]
MIRKITGFSLLGTALLGLMPLACQPGGVGDPCTPEDEYTQNFAGYNANEVNVESKSFQCETRVCLVNHFQGRVSCEYGQSAVGSTTGPTNCYVPGTAPAVGVAPTAQNLPITQVVLPQRSDRTADKAVYCSCRCDGDDKNARYCKCPSGYACSHLVDDLHLGGGQLAGSYCVRDGTTFDPTKGTDCSPSGYPLVTTKQSGAKPSCGEPTTN